MGLFTSGRRLAAAVGFYRHVHAAPGAAAGPDPEAMPAPARGRKGWRMADRVSIIIFCQSLGWSLMEELHFLEGLAANRTAMRPVLGGPAASLATLLSGRMPAEHGHFAWLRYSPATSPFRACRFYAFLPGRNSRTVRRRALESVRRSSGANGRLSLFNVPLQHLPLFDFVERRDLFEPEALGEVKTLIDILIQSGSRFYASSFRRSDPDNADALADALKAGALDTAILHIGGLERVLAERGPGSPGTRGRIAWLDHRVRKLCDIASSRYAGVDLVVLSDTGVVPVRGLRDLHARLATTGCRYGRDYVAMYSPTMAQFWYASDSGRGAVPVALAATAGGNLLAEEQLKAEGCWSPDHRFGESIFLAEPGTRIAPNFIESDGSVALSGYHPDTPGMEAGIVTNMQDIELPTDVRDVFPLLADVATHRRARLQREQSAATPATGGTAG